MKLLKSKWLILTVAVLAIAAFAGYRLTRKSKIELFTAKVERGDIRSLVEATGTINAVTSVQVGSQVSGRIYRLHADFNSRVTQGQLLAEIDPALFEGNVQQSRADLENARANLAAAKANLLRAQATAQQSRADFRRTEELARQGVMSAQQLDVSKANAESADASVTASDAQVTQAAAQVRQREATLKVAETNLRYTRIYAPINGIVVNRAVDVGQTVAASMQAPTLFTIAQDLSQMQVYAKTDEGDVGQIRPGQRVSFTVDAFPGERFAGRVSQVRMNPTVVQNVVTYDTIVDFHNEDMKLFPGMTAYITIPVQTVRNVLSVPNGALRYTPDLQPTELRALLDQHGIQTGARRAPAETSEAQPGAPAPRPISQTSGTDSGAASDAADVENAGNRRARLVLVQAEGGEPAGRRGGRFGRQRMGNQEAEAQGDGAQPNGFQGRMQRGGNGAEADADAPAGGMRGMRGRGGRGGGGMRDPNADLAIVWKQGPEQTFVPIQIRKGLTDHTVTEVVQVLKGDLKEGDELIIGSRSVGGSAATAAPGMGGARGGRGRGF
ncbi:MAG: efflux RND transporter periplasmic adaptor subunit [Candidatus Korobacteraceae bacterium]